MLRYDPPDKTCPGLKKLTSTSISEVMPPKYDF